MSEMFLKIINMSISASYIVLAVLLLRLLLKKAPKWITVVLWGIVSVRLVCPFSIESVLSLIPSSEVVSPTIMTDKTPTINTGIPIINSTLNPVISESFTPNPGDSANPLQIWIPVLTTLWIVGMVALLIYTVISFAKVKRKIGTAVLLRDNIYQSENVVSPFVLGIIKPKIYLPFNMNEKDMEHVVAHEMAHIRRKDHLWKPLGFILLTLHWFNPLMWLGYVLLCRDIELACDEKVIKELDHDARADYSQALLTCSVNRRMIAACPLAFGEVGVKDRVKSVLNYKKPAFWIIIAAVVACVVVAVCFLTNPNAKRDYICRIVDDLFTKGAVESDLTEPFIDEELRDELLLDIVRDNFKSFKEPISLEIQSTTYMLYNGKDTAVYLVKVNDSEDFTTMCMAYIQPRGNKEALGQVKNDSNENAELLQYIELNISEEKLSYETLKQHQEEIWAYRTAAINDTVDETFRKWGERIAAVGVNEERNCVNVYVYDFDKGDIGRFKKALGHLSYVLIQKEDVIEMIPDDKKQLTLEDVIELSAKGQSLSWDDFEAFNFKETGSGLYIRVYEIDETFSVWIGGGSPVTIPMYIYLSANGLDNRIDIRYDIVEHFIDKHKNIHSQMGSVYDTATFDVDGDGKDENCSLCHGRTSGLFTFIFFVQDKETGDVENETTIYSQVYEPSFQKGADGKMKVQGITQGENPETHLFDISIKDGYVNLTENGVPIGEIN